MRSRKQGEGEKVQQHKERATQTVKKRVWGGGGEKISKLCQRALSYLIAQTNRLEESDCTSDSTQVLEDLVGRDRNPT